MKYSNQLSSCTSWLLLQAILSVSLFCTPSFGNNNRLLPGDAYFPTQLTAEEVDALQAQEAGPYVFQYSSFDTYGMTFCGYAGYEYVTFETVNEEFVNHLAAAYRAIRERQPRVLLEEKKDGKTTLVEQNGIRVFFYPAEFDLDRYNIALRYNEGWAEEAVRFGHRPDHLRLCCMLSSPHAVMMSWRDSKHGAGLDLIRPINKTDRLGDDAIAEQPSVQPVPVVIRGKVKAVIALRPSLDDYFSPAANEYLPLHVVHSNGHGEITRKDGKWVPVEDVESPF